MFERGGENEQSSGWRFSANELGFKPKWILTHVCAQFWKLVSSLINSKVLARLNHSYSQLD